MAPIAHVLKDGEYHIDPSNSMNVIKHFDPWYPPGISVQDVLWGGHTAQVAKLTDSTVLKFVWDKDDFGAKQCLEIEHSILSALGNHERIIKYLRKHEHGLEFGLAAYGDVRRYLEARQPSESPEALRRKWARQAAEALAFIHAKEVIHCDVHPNNLLLDEHLNIQLCDFGGSTFSILDGGAMESVRFFLPRDPLSVPNIRSDLFALGSTIYFIMSDYEPYHQMTEEQVADYFRKREFPDVQELPYGRIIEGCWKGEFSCTLEVIDAMSDDIVTK